MNDKLTNYKNILEKKAFMNISTIMKDGSSQTTPVWFSIDKDYFFVNTAVGRTKDRNMKRTPKVSFSIQDPENPYNYLGVIGKIVDRTLNGADEHIDQLAKKYLNVDSYPYRTDTETRVIYKIKPLSVFGVSGN